MSKNRKVRRTKQNISAKRQKAAEIQKQSETKKETRIVAENTTSKGSGKRGRNRIRTVSMDELREEYAYVIKDLRRIFILAIVMFVLLFGANFAFPLIFG